METERNYGESMVLVIVIPLTQTGAVILMMVICGKNPDVIGVQQGAVLIAIENARTGLVKNTITNLPYIQNGLSMLGFTTDTTPPAQITTLYISNVPGNGIKLNWLSTGNDNYNGNISNGIYEIRFSTNPISSHSSSAPRVNLRLST